MTVFPAATVTATVCEAGCSTSNPAVADWSGSTTVYAPGATLGNTYAPLASVVATATAPAATTTC